MTDAIHHAEHTPMQVRDTVMGAISWLERNPAFHIERAYATTSDRRTCEPTHPQATCFCVLGRIMHDADMSYGSLRDYLDRIGVSSSRLLTINDTRVTRRIEFLRNYVEGSFGEKFKCK